MLFAVAFALVLKVTRLFNFAQAAIMTIAFYTAFVAVQWLEWPAWAAFVAMMVGDARRILCAGAHRLRGAPAQRGVSVMFVFVFTFMVSEFVAYVAMLIFGTWPQTIFPIDLLAGDARRRYRGERLGLAGDRLPRSRRLRRSSPSCASPAPGSS